MFCLQVDNYETSVFMPPERAEDMAQLNLGVHFLRLGAWDELSSVSKMPSAVLNPCPCCLSFLSGS